MYTIPKSKFGDCYECGAENTQCVKHGKNLFCINCRNNQKREEMLKRMENKETKRASGRLDNRFVDRQSIIDDLDFVFSRYIRLKEASPDGHNNCYTCDKREHWSSLQAGHFVKRGESFLRWDTRNVRPQCVECNCERHGNIEKYAELLNSEFPGLADTLREEGREVYKYTRDELKELLISYRAKLKLVESKLK